MSLKVSLKLVGHDEKNKTKQTIQINGRNRLKRTKLVKCFSVWMCEALGYSMIIWSYQCCPLKIHLHITPKMTLSATVFENTQTMKCTAWSPSSCSPLLLWESTLRKETKWLGKSDSWKLKLVSSSWVHKNLPKKRMKVWLQKG